MQYKDKINNFTDLVTWQEAHKLVLQTYKATKKFPADELYSLVNQMRCCVVSITSNIAEGFSRQTKKEKLQFYSIAKGSLTELQNQLILARDVEYINQGEFNSYIQQTYYVSKLITGSIRAIKEF